MEVGKHTQYPWTLRYVVVMLSLIALVSLIDLAKEFSWL